MQCGNYDSLDTSQWLTLFLSGINIHTFTEKSSNDKLKETSQTVRKYVEIGMPGREKKEKGKLFLEVYIIYAYREIVC